MEGGDTSILSSSLPGGGESACKLRSSHNALGLRGHRETTARTCCVGASSGARVACMHDRGSPPGKTGSASATVLSEEPGSDRLGASILSSTRCGWALGGRPAAHQQPRNFQTRRTSDRLRTRTRAVAASTGRPPTRVRPTGRMDASDTGMIEALSSPTLARPRPRSSLRSPAWSEDAPPSLHSRAAQEKAWGWTSRHLTPAASTSHATFPHRPRLDMIEAPAPTKPIRLRPRSSPRSSACKGLSPPSSHALAGHPQH